MEKRRSPVTEAVIRGGITTGFSGWQEPLFYVGCALFEICPTALELFNANVQ